MKRGDARQTGRPVQFLQASDGPTSPAWTSDIDAPAASGTAFGQVLNVSYPQTWNETSSGIQDRLQMAQESLSDATVQYIAVI